MTPEASASLIGEISRRGLQLSTANTLAPAALTANNHRKAPWRPKVAGRIGFWFGPVSGALVVADSLRRIGHRKKARNVLLLGLGLAALEMTVVFLVPDVVGRLIGLGAEIAFLLIFPPLMEGEFNGWQAENKDVSPANGWKAIGWGAVGVALLLAIATVVFFVLSAVFPGIGE
jgi:hypothetical protein